ncbi:MAG: tetratricopeptide repeat protein [Acidobacteria bacterium]|nr:tetratricopeptide repeat protein [Acidobacteriota bacterium]
MIESAPLLGAKLLPPTPGPFHLRRSRLLQRLAGGLEGRAAVVLAGPGYGKTSLVARFLQEQGGDSVWYSLDPTDRDPWMFFRYLIQGVKEHAPEFGERTEGLWTDLRSRSDEVERLADLFIGDAEESLGGRLILVLDEVHHLEESVLCARALKRLLAYLPGTLHLILIGRSLPDLGVQSLLADDAVHVLQGEDLLFTLAETRTLLLDTFGLPMQPDTVDKVHARTRGWVTALQLLRHTARLDPAKPDLPEEVFARTESGLFDYFSEEVLAAEGHEVREFLLGSSVPVVVDPDICAEVLRGSDVRGILEGLLKRKLFISPLESHGEYCAYDPLFRDFLRRKLRAEKGAEGARDLDRRYGKAFARRGDFAQALAHLIAAEEAKGITEVLGRHGKALLRAGMLDTVRDAAFFLAGRGVRSPLLDDLLGEACRQAGDYAAAVGHFEKALAAHVNGTPGLSGGTRASTLQGLAYSLLKVGDMRRAAATAEDALKEAGGEDPALLARILNTLSIIRYREERHPEALAGWQESLARARQAGDEHLTLMIAHNLGLPHAVMGDFRRASECFRILTGPGNHRVGPEEGAAYLNLARIETLRGEYSRAAALLGDAREIAHKLRLHALGADVLEAEGTLLRETGDLEAARERYAHARSRLTELGLIDLLEGLAEEEAILASRRGEHEDAEGLAARTLERQRTSNDREGIASALLALGEVRVRAGEPERALPVLAESAAIFASLRRSYQRCMACLWLALACFRTGKRRRSTEAAACALKLAAEYDYRAPVLRVAELDEGMRRFLGTLPSAPGYLKEKPAREKGAAVSLGMLARDGADLTVRLLGPIEVFRDIERKVPARAWKIKRALQIFCYLASSHQHRAAKERIVDALWGDARLSVIEKNFHPTISFLRRALNAGHNVPKNFILFEGGAYLLNPTYRYAIDAEIFEARVRAARERVAQRKFSVALSEYDAALALYRGPFLEEDYEEWAEAPRAHYEGLHLAALKEAGELHLKEGDRDAGLGYLERLVERDPLNEEASARLMGALGGLGNRAGVEKEFGRLSRSLSQELSTDPLPETRRAYEKALAHGTPGPARKRPHNRPSQRP